MEQALDFAIFARNLFQIGQIINMSIVRYIFFSQFEEWKLKVWILSLTHNRQG
jgi:hypothetical protein